MRGRRSRPIVETLPDPRCHVHGLLPARGGQPGGRALLAFPLPPCTMSLAMQGAASAPQFLLRCILGTKDVRKEAR